MTSQYPRLRSLDALRGATIAGMMLVNNPGSWGHVYTAFNHTPWIGWTFADTIFPTFLWIVGVAIVLSVRRRLADGCSHGDIVLQAARRSAILFLLGLFLSIFPIGLLFGQTIDLSGWRIPGILPRIAVCSFAATLIFLWSGRRTRIIWIVGLLAGYWMLLKLVPVPGYGAGVLEPVGSLPWYVDFHVFGARTWLWTWWRNAPSPGFDPEGLLSTIPAVATVLFGVVTGEFLTTQRTPADRSARLFMAGSLLMLAGLTMEPWLPMIKGLWTSSFAVFMAGVSTFVFAAFTWLVEGYGMTRGIRWLEIYGQNAIAMFFLAGVVERVMVLVSWEAADGSSSSLHDRFFQTVFLSWIGDPYAASLVHAGVMMLTFYGVAAWMHRHRWYVRV